MNGITMNGKKSGSVLKFGSVFHKRNNEYDKDKGFSDNSNVDSIMEFSTSQSSILTDNSDGGEVKHFGQKVEKKKKVKKCLAELKSLLGSGDNHDTLSTLQSVLQQLKKASKDESSSRYLTSSSSCIFVPQSRYPNHETEELQHADNCKVFTIKILKDQHTITNISKDLLQMLNLSKADMLGKNFQDFVYRKDLGEFVIKMEKLSMKSYYSDDNFFIRLMFPLTKTQYVTRPYEVFSVKIHTGSLTPSSVDTDDSEIILETTFIESMYMHKNWNEVNRKCKFKHCISGKVIHVDSSAVALLGYLPQDLHGTSLVDYIHPEDYCHIMDLYEELVEKQGSTVCSRPVRFKVQNGDNISAIIELCCFFKATIIDFVCGSIEVVRGPENLDIFMENVDHINTFSLPDENRKEELKRKIKEKLNQIQGDCEDNNEELSDQKSVSRGTTNQNSDQTGTSSMMISDLTDKEVHKAYVSMTYFSSIQRFLERDDNVTLDTCLESFGNADVDCVTELETACEQSTDCNSSMHAVPPDEDLEPINQSPPFGSVWTPGHHGKILHHPLDMGHIAMETNGGASHDVSSNYQPVKRLTEENLVKHQISERRKYLKSIQSNKELRKLYSGINAKKGSPYGIKKRKLSRAKEETEKEGQTASKLVKDHSGNPVCAVATTLSNQPFRVTCMDNPATCSVPYYVGMNPDPQVGHMFAQQNQTTIQPFYMPGIGIMTTQQASIATSISSPINASAQPLRFGMRQNASAINNRGHLPYGLIPTHSCIHYTNKEGFNLPNSGMNKKTMEEIPSTNSTVNHKNKERDETPVCETPLEDEEDSESDWFYSDLSLTVDAGADERKPKSKWSNSDNSPSPSKVTPYWLDTVNSCDEMNDYVVNLDEGTEENFLQQLNSLNQSKQVLTQVMQHELDKIDMDLNQESDNSNLFIPFKRRDLDSKWETIVAHQKTRHSLLQREQYSSTDSSTEAEHKFKSWYLKPSSSSENCFEQWSSKDTSTGDRNLNGTSEKREETVRKCIKVRCHDHKSSHRSNKKKPCAKDNKCVNFNKSSRKFIHKSVTNVNSVKIKPYAPSHLKLKVNKAHKLIQKRKTGISPQSSEVSPDETVSTVGYEASEESVVINATLSFDEVNEEDEYYNQKLSTRRQADEYKDENNVAVNSENVEGIKKECYETVSNEKDSCALKNNQAISTTDLSDITATDMLGNKYLHKLESSNATHDSGFHSSSYSLNTDSNRLDFIDRYSNHSLSTMCSSNKVLLDTYLQKNSNFANGSSSINDSGSMGSASSGCKCSGSGSDEQCRICSKPAKK